MENQEIFSTSLYGRFGYFVMSIAATLVMSIFAGVLKDIIYGNYTDGILFGIFIILYEISVFYLLMNCLRNLLNPSFRLKITNDDIIYNGIFSMKSFAFESINKITIDFSGSKSPFVYLIPKSGGSGECIMKSNIATSPTHHSGLRFQILEGSKGVVGEILKS